MALKVIAKAINEGQNGQFFVLATVKEGWILFSAPNNWRTKRGAERWAIKHGYEVEG